MEKTVTANPHALGSRTWTVAFPIAASRVSFRLQGGVVGKIGYRSHLDGSDGTPRYHARSAMRAVWVRCVVVAAIAGGAAFPVAVSRLSPAAAQTTCPAQTQAIPPTSASPNLLAPAGIAVDGAGNIYASDETTHTLYRFNASGTQTLAIPPASATPNLADPVGIAVDSAGNIYTADRSTKTLYRFNASGTQTMAIPSASATPNL
jgi:outer membrane protein assembly factor BamB